MPVEFGVDDKGCFARWGQKGAKYHYNCKSTIAKFIAKEKAASQGRAIQSKSK